ncbi:MAG: hypothetical protein AB1634_13075 [Thermodesulfobacteriota bacterium]
MKRSEQILLGLTGLAALYGAYVFLVEPRKTGPAATSAGPIVAAVTAELAASPVPAGVPLAQVRERLADTWSADRFLTVSFRRELERQAQEGQRREVLDASGFQYTGFAEMGDARIAIINGLDYREGDEMEGFIIGAIGPEMVELVQGEQKVLVPIVAGE